MVKHVRVVQKTHYSGHFVQTETLRKYTDLTTLSTHLNSKWVVVVHGCKNFCCAPCRQYGEGTNFNMQFFLNYEDNVFAPQE